jgi:hypothetical protein
MEYSDLSEDTGVKTVEGLLREKNRKLETENIQFKAHYLNMTG